MSHRLSILLLAVLASPVVAQTTPPTTKPAAPTPPAYTPVRWNENYSYLKDQSQKTDRFDSIKYIPLGDDAYLSLGGQLRYRYEGWNNENFGAVSNDWGYLLQRYLVHGDLHVGDFRLFAQAKVSIVDDGRQLPAGSARPVDADEIDIQQLFADYKFHLSDTQSLTARFGRQDLIYGAQRLISPLDWTNVRRTFEGAKLSYQSGKTLSIDAFLVRPVNVDKDELNDGDGNTTFGGIYATYTLDPKTTTKLEGYLLGNWKQNKNATGLDADVDTYTAGFRYSGQPKPWDYDVELAYQFGSAGQSDISAYSVALEAGYTFADVALSPRVYLGFDYASGDDDAGDDELNTFNQLYPLGHAYFGYIDVIGRANVIDIHPGVELLLAKEKSYAKKLSLRADYHMFWRASDQDGLYNVAGAQSRAGAGVDGTYIGSEFDLFLNWQINRHAAAYFGYSHFFAGEFIENSAGPDDDIDFFYAAFTYTF